MEDGATLETLAIKYNVKIPSMQYRLRQANDPRVFEKLRNNPGKRKKEYRDNIIMILKCRKCGKVNNLTERKYDIDCECGMNLIYGCVINHKGSIIKYLNPKLRGQESIMKYDKYR